MRDLAAIFLYLGIELTRDRVNRTLFIEQTAFIDRMLEDLGIEKFKSTKVPMVFGTEMVKNWYIGEDYKVTKEEIKGYQSLVGNTLWLVFMTRPDISFAVGKCSQYSSNATPSHDVFVKKIVWYLNGSKELGLWYDPRLKNKDRKLLDYTDTSYGDCHHIYRVNSA